MSDSRLVTSLPHPSSLPLHPSPSLLAFSHLGQISYFTNTTFHIISPHLPHPHSRPPLPVLPPDSQGLILSDQTTDVAIGNPNHEIIKVFSNTSHVLIDDEGGTFNRLGQPVKGPAGSFRPSTSTSATVGPGEPVLGGLASSRSRRGVQMTYDSLPYHSEGAGFIGTKDQSSVGGLAACWSPRGVGVDGGCVLAILDKWLNLTIRAAPGDGVRGKWEVIADISQQIHRLSDPATSEPNSAISTNFPMRSGNASPSASAFPTANIKVEQPEYDSATPEPGQPRAGYVTKSTRKHLKPASADTPIDPRAVARSLELQLTCIAWSEAIAWDPPYGMRLGSGGIGKFGGVSKGAGGSLLAVGTRGGGVSLWSMGQDGQMIRLYNEVVTDDWTCKLAWSEWRATGKQTRTASLALSKLDGSVHRLVICRRFSPADGSVDLDVAKKPKLSSKGDGRALTAMRWVHGSLICARVGTIEIITADSGSLSVIQLKKIGKWAGCTDYGTVSGMGALPDKRLLVTMNSGEQHVINKTSSAPTYDLEASIAVTQTVRAALQDAWDIVKSPKLSPRVVGADMLPNAITGGSTLLACVLEPLCMHDLSIPRENTRSHTVVMVDLSGELELLEGDMDGMEVEHIGSANVNATSPSANLLPYLPRLNRPVDIASRGLQLNFPQYEDDTPTVFDEPLSRKESTSTLAYELLEAHGVRHRMTSLLWSKCLSANPPQNTYPLGQLMKDPEARSELAVFKCILLWLAQCLMVQDAGSSKDAGLILRYLAIGEAHFKDSPDTRIQNARRALGKFAQLHADADKEPCPICREDFNTGTDPNTMTIICGRSHKWSRCAVTRQIIKTPRVRTCSGCHRKSLLPPANTESAIGGVITRELLLAASSCPWCGSSWTLPV